jgi:hypothetical protein
MTERTWGREETIEVFKKDQAFSLSSDLAPPPPPPPPLSPSHQTSSSGHTGRSRKREKIANGSGGGVGGAKSFHGEKAWYSTV